MRARDAHGNRKYKSNSKKSDPEKKIGTPAKQQPTRRKKKRAAREATLASAAKRRKERKATDTKRRKAEGKTGASAGGKEREGGVGSRMKARKVPMLVNHRT